MLAAVVLFAPAALMQEKGGEGEFGAYDIVLNWPQALPGPDNVGWTWGSTGGVYAESADRIWVAQRGQLPLPKGAQASGTEEGRRVVAVKPGDSVGLHKGNANQMRTQTRWTNCIFVVDRDGKLVESWTQHDKMMSTGGKGPHAIKMNPYDPDKHIWVVGDSAQAVFKFTRDGKLVMTIGELGVAGNDDKHFNEPTDLDWLPDGTFFVSDGYKNTRVVKFDKNGKFLMAWGKKPADPERPGPGEFNTVHGISVGKNRRVYVSDRGNRRIQVFDENGKFLDEWPDLRAVNYTFISSDQYLWTADNVLNRIAKFDLNGKFLYGFGISATPRGGDLPGFIDGPHQISVDQEKNLYIAEVDGGRVQKFTPKRGANQSMVIQPELRWGDKGTH
jgi:sugar lactone lactonase YvrE